MKKYMYPEININIFDVYAVLLIIYLDYDKLDKLSYITIISKFVHNGSSFLLNNQPSLEN